MTNREKCKFRIRFRILHRGETASLIWSLAKELDSGGADTEGLGTDENITLTTRDLPFGTAQRQNETTFSV